MNKQTEQFLNTLVQPPKDWATVGNVSGNLNVLANRELAFVTPDNGVMVEPRQPDELQRGLKTALDRNWDRSAISRAMSRTWDDVARETLAVCEGLAG
mgnify:CR=1 FL=1